MLDLHFAIIGMQVTGTFPIYRLTCDTCNHESRGCVATAVIFQHAAHRCEDNLV